MQLGKSGTVTNPSPSGGANGLRNAKKLTYRDSDDKPVATEEGTVADPSNPVLVVLTRADLSYDSRRNPVREAVSAGGAVQGVVDRSFDDRGRPVCEARRMNPAAYGEAPGACAFTTQGSHGPDRISRNLYDNAGQLLQVQKAFGTPLQQNYVTYTYSPNGRQASVTDANSNRAELRYDGHDRQVRWVFPSKTTPGAVNEADYESYGYDSVGNRTSLRKRDGSVLSYQYDALNRMTVKIVPERAGLAAAHTRDVHYDYDYRGLMTKARFDSLAGEGITNVYDGFGRLVSSSSDMGGTARAVGNLYDAGGNRIRVAHPDGSYFTYESDAAGRLLRVRENGGDPIAAFTWDGAGRLASGAQGLSAYAYDPLGRLQTLTHNPAGTDRDHALGFAYNPASQIVTRTASNDAYAFTGAANTSRAYTVNGLNQYTAAGPATFGYDPNGNLGSTVNAPWSTAYVYDVENRLVSATGTHNAELIYDPLGRLFQVSSGASVRRLVYDGDALIAEYDSAGGMSHRYIHGNQAGADDPLVWYDNYASGWRRVLLSDHQGSVIGVTDMYGNSLAANAYDAWGIPNAANLGRFGYTGQTWVPELGLWYYKARFYSPTVGRFLQVDPIGYDDQANLYTYVGNDPMNKVDPTGMHILGCAGKRVSSGCSGASILSNMTSRNNSSVVGIRSRHSRGGQLVNAVINDPDVRDQMNTAWKLSRGDSGPTGKKNEYGFWITQVGRDFVPGRLIKGEGEFIYRQDIKRAHEQTPDARIFFHVHPFRTGERFNIRSIDISDGDRRVGMGFRAMVISAARPEPYTGRNVWVDYTDDFYEYSKR